MAPQVAQLRRPARRRAPVAPPAAGRSRGAARRCPPDAADAPIEAEVNGQEAQLGEQLGEPHIGPVLDLERDRGGLAQRRRRRWPISPLGTVMCTTVPGRYPPVGVKRSVVGFGCDHAPAVDGDSLGSVARRQGRERRGEPQLDRGVAGRRALRRRGKSAAAPAARAWPPPPARAPPTSKTAADEPEPRELSCSRNYPSGRSTTRSSSATHSMCGVCGNMSTARTRRNR